MHRLLLPPNSQHVSYKYTSFKQPPNTCIQTIIITGGTWDIAEDQVVLFGLRLARALLPFGINVTRWIIKAHLGAIVAAPLFNNNILIQTLLPPT
jgi:hypothetical protein